MGAGVSAYDRLVTPQADRPTIAIAICTYRRPEVLRELLHRLVDVAADATTAVVGVVVADDDPHGSAAAVVESMHGAFAGGVRYVHSASGNIATARNRALEEAVDRVEWIAMIDDDCIPAVDWIRQLLAVQAATGAQCVTGACRDVAPPGAPGWLTAEPFLEGESDEEDGSERDIGHLKNTLISTEFVRRHHLRFDPAYGTSGGEDVMFFHAAADRGVRHHYAARALVEEVLPLERATFAYQVRRRLWYGHTEALTTLASARSSRARTVARGIKLVVLALARPLVHVVRGQRPQVRFAVASVAQGLGRVLGAVGVGVSHR